MPPSTARARSIWPSPLIADRFSPPLRLTARRNGNAPRNLPRRVDRGAKEDGTLRRPYLEAAVVQGLAIVRRGLLLHRLGLRFRGRFLRRARLVGYAAVVENLPKTRRGPGGR